MIMRTFLLLALVAICASFDFKKLQGPPEEFSNFNMPSDAESAIETSGSYIPVTFNDNNVFTTNMYVDTGSFGFCGISPLIEEFVYSFQIPGSSISLTLSQLLDKFEGKEFVDELTLGDSAEYSATCYQFDDAAVGIYKVTISLVGAQQINCLVAPCETNKLSGYFLVHNESPFKIKAYNSNNGIVDQEIQLIAQIEDRTDREGLILNTPGFTAVSQVQVIEPNGVQLNVELKDDGLCGDFLANDGIFGGKFQADQTGSYRLNTLIIGNSPAGVAFERTVEHVLTVVDSTIAFKQGTKAAATYDEKTLQIKVEFTGGQENSQQFLAYAEVWGKNSQGADVAIAWVNGMETYSGDAHAAKSFSFELNKNWITRSGAKAPFTLKNARIQDKGIFVVLATAASIEIHMEAEALEMTSQLSVASSDFEITEEMRNGERPQQFRKRSSAAKGKKILVHGYCSDANSWPVEDFTDYAVFKDPKQNRDVDTFSKMVQQFAKDQGIESYSLIAHSQGGLVSLHTRAFYWTGLDMATGGRLVQSVGSPYQGTALAGGLAGLGDLFGVGCGSNEGMTKAGGASWFATIPKDKQEDVWYFTTRGKSSCSTAANWMGLDSPNDGVVSHDFAKVKYGTPMGDTVGWCHSDDMSSPYQNDDHARNKILNDNAAL